MSNIIKGIKLNEVDPRNFDSDIGYYNALNRPMRPKRSEDDYVDPADKYDEPISAQKKVTRPEYSESNDEDRQAGYNMTLTVKAPTTQAAEFAASSYVDNNWGAKKQIGKITPVSDGVVKVHMLDNHKYGMWKPWKDEEPISKPISFNESAIIDEATQLLESLDPASRTKVISELSNDLLGRYKKAAGADASAADKKGDYERGNKRFKGIVKATKKEFDNDTKGVAEDELDENCWKGYHKEGNKELFGKTVPNCVKNESEEVTEEKCPHCGGPMFSEMIMNEKKDACYYKVKSRYKVWPSAYASGALVKCRNKGASNWGNSTKNESSILEGIEQVDENLHKWFKEKWVRFGPDGKIRGDCARGDDSEGKPKCLPQSKAHSLGKKGRASAAARKRREDPNPERSGKAINVNTKKKANEGVTEETIHVGHRNSKGDWIKTSTHNNYTDAKAAMKELEKAGKKGVQHRYDNKGNIDPGAMMTARPDSGVAEEQLDEKWSQKYKDSINCSNPKGFSQRAHCQGKKK